MKNKHSGLLKKYMIGAAAAAAVIITPVVSTLTSNQKNSSIQVVNNNTSTKQVDTISTDVVHVLTPDSPGLTQDQVQKIRNLYSLKPSTILTNLTAGNGIDETVANGGVNGTDWPSNSIFNILSFGSTFLNASIVQPGNGSASPQVFNLASTDAYNSAPNQNWNLVQSEALPAFSANNSSENASSLVVNQNYLDSIGVLPLEIVFYTKTGNTYNSYVMYMMISGFGAELSENDLSSNPVLQSSAYTQMVDQISNSELTSFPKFSDSSVLPNKISLVSDSRVNDMTTGTISFKLDFSWYTPTDFQFDSTFPGIAPSTPASGTTVSPSYQNSVSNDMVATSYTQSFKYSGFQPSPNTSTQDVIYILIGIIVGTIVVVILVYIVSILILRRIREKRAV